ncbi:MAG: hypothetical protein V3S55_10560 [Nitrospiraceae bacterium]
MRGVADNPAERPYAYRYNGQQKISHITITLSVRLEDLGVRQAA